MISGLIHSSIHRNHVYFLNKYMSVYVYMVLPGSNREKLTQNIKICHILNKQNVGSKLYAKWQMFITLRKSTRAYVLLFWQLDLEYICTCARYLHGLVYYDGMKIDSQTSTVSMHLKEVREISTTDMGNLDQNSTLTKENKVFFQ